MFKQSLHKLAYIYLAYVYLLCSEWLEVSWPPWSVTLESSDYVELAVRPSSNQPGRGWSSLALRTVQHDSWAESACQWMNTRFLETVYIFLLMMVANTTMSVVIFRMDGTVSTPPTCRMREVSVSLFIWRFLHFILLIFPTCLFVCLLIRVCLL